MSFSRRGKHSHAARPSIVVAIRVLLFVILTGLPARSQSEAGKAVKSLSVPTQMTVKELSSLVSLPADDWRFHAGDAAHGESTDLDDSGWQTVKERYPRSERSGLVSPHDRSAEDLQRL